MEDHEILLKSGGAIHFHDEFQGEIHLTSWSSLVTTRLERFDLVRFTSVR